MEFISSHCNRIITAIIRFLLQGIHVNQSNFLTAFWLPLNDFSILFWLLVEDGTFSPEGVNILQPNYDWSNVQMWPLNWQMLYSLVFREGYAVPIVVHNYPQKSHPPHSPWTIIPWAIAIQDNARFPGGEKFSEG